MAKTAEVPGLVEKMLGQVLVTKQTGEEGKPVNTLYVAQKMQLAREMYFAIALDRASAGPVMIACSEGGTSIEDLAEKFPEKIIKVPVDLRVGITQEQAMQVRKHSPEHGLRGTCWVRHDMCFITSARVLG